MMKSTFLKSILMASLVAVGVCGCTVGVEGPGGEVEVASPPPAALVDLATPQPGRDFVWIGGNWVWGGHGWTWEHGRWERPPYRGATWQAHRYAYRNGKHVFTRGHWR